jgi:hypothetical protein
VTVACDRHHPEGLPTGRQRAAQHYTFGRIPRTHIACSVTCEANATRNVSPAGAALLGG